MGMVFPTSTHNYEIRYWLAAAGIHPGMHTATDIGGRTDAEVELSVTPPPMMSWHYIAECELSAFSRQCLQCRIAGMGELRTEVAAWTKERNGKTVRINWHFFTSDARIKLKTLFPSIEPG